MQRPGGTPPYLGTLYLPPPAIIVKHYHSILYVVPHYLHFVYLPYFVDDDICCLFVYFCCCLLLCLFITLLLELFGKRKKAFFKTGTACTCMPRHLSLCICISLVYV